MKQLRVFLLQMHVDDDNVQNNLETIIAAIDRAAEEGADLLLTPEGALSGYHSRFDQQQVTAALEQVRAYAQQRGVGLALGVCIEEADGLKYNEVRLYDKSGAYLGFHSKILRCSSPTPDYDSSLSYFEEHINFAAAPLRTFDFHGIPMGVLICNDLWAHPQYTGEDDPHLLQKLSMMGAKVVLHAVNSYSDAEHLELTRSFHEANLRVRAEAAKIPVVTVNNVADPEVPLSSPSGCIGAGGQWIYRLADIGAQQGCICIEIQ